MTYQWTVEKFMAKVNKTDTCWHWTGGLSTGAVGGGRYGSLVDLGRTYKAHRWAYEHLVGPIPEGLEIDHVCHNLDPTCPGSELCAHRQCVNPAHLEAVTRSVNLMRRMRRNPKTHCKWGHELSPENIRVWPTPTGEMRQCKECGRRNVRESRARKRAAAMTTTTTTA